jgi:hypothetical protein
VCNSAKVLDFLCEIVYYREIRMGLVGYRDAVDSSAPILRKRTKSSRLRKMVDDDDDDGASKGLRGRMQEM